MTMKKFYLLVIAIALSIITYGQSITNYGFSASSGTFTALSGGTNPVNGGGLDLGYYNSIPIGFTFTYNGIAYTTCASSTDGALVLGGTLSGGMTTNNLSTGTPRPILAPLWDDNALTALTDFTYQTTGAAGSRIFTAEWLNVKWNYNATSGCVSFQVKLYEADGKIQFIYHQLGGTLVTPSASIGITAVGTAAGNFLSLNNSGASPTISSTTETTTIATLPAEGQTYTFTAPLPCVAPSVQPTVLNLTPSTTTITGSFTAAAGADSYLVVRSSNVTLSSNPVNGTIYTAGTTLGGGVVDYSGIATTFSSSGLTPNSLYYYFVFATNNATCTNGPLYLTTSPLTNSTSTLPVFPVSGTKSVGPTGDYATLTAAFQYLNANGVSGAINLVLQSTYLSSAEPAFPIPVLAIPGASPTFTTTVYPSVTGLSITSSSTTGTINMNGATYVVFDGRVNASGTTKDLIIENTNLTGYGIQLINGASNNTLKYCTIKGVSTATTNGNITFGGTTGSTGNNNNLIDNCALRDGATTPAALVYSLGTTSLPNINNIISNSNLFNWFVASTTAQTAAVNLLTGNSDWTITANSFYQTATRTYTSSGIVSVININNTYNGGNFTISNNYVGGTLPLCAGTPMTLSATTGTPIYRLIYITHYNAAGTPSNVTGNTISNIAMTTASASTALSIFSHLNGNVNFTNNTIGSQTATGNITMVNSGTSTAAIFFVFNSGTGATFSNINISNNNLGGIAVSALTTGATAFRIVYSQPPLGSNITISGNSIGGTVANSITQGTNAIMPGIMILNPTIGNIVTNNIIRNLSHTNVGVTGSVTGINVQSGGGHTITGNQIYNLTTNSTNVAANNAASIVGLTMTASINPGTVVSQNTIYNLVNTNATVAGSVIGLYFGTPAIGQTTISRNLVHSFSTASALSNQIGIAVPNTGKAIVTNNMVRLGIDASGASQTGSVAITGIYKGSTNNVGVYFNSVYIGGTAVVSGAVNSYAFRRVTSGVADTVVNNIFVNNRSNTSGTGKHYAINTNTSTNLICNNNLYQATGTGGVFGINVAADYATIGAWRAGTNLDAASGYGDPNFVLATGTSTTVDLHVQSSTAVEAGGMPISSVPIDFDGASRTGLTPFDIGADAGNFTSSGDIYPPAIAFVPLSNGANSNRVLTNFATITDNLAVSGGASLPRIYYKKSTDANAFVGNTSANNGWKYVVASNSSSPYSFTIDYSIINGGSVIAGDVIQYFVVAQDAANNLSSNFGGAAASGNPPVQNINLAPTTPLSYTIAASLSGVLTVGTGGTYPSLTGAGGAFAAINTASVSGDITLQIVSDLTEDGTNALNQFGAYTVNIVPNSATERLISGAVANGMIRLDGADVVTIDGRFNGSGRYLRFRNTNTANPTLTLINDATNNTIRSCYLEGANTSTTSGVVLLSTTTGMMGNDNNTFNSNVFRDLSSASGVPANLIYSAGTALKENSSVSFTSNEFLNFSNAGIVVSATGNGDYWGILGNSFYNNLAVPPSTLQYAINFVPGALSNGNMINSNFIGGQSASCGGTAWTNSGIVSLYGIYLTTGLGVSTSVQGNTFQNIAMTNTGGSSFIGIYATAGNINIGNISGNTFGHATTANSILLSGTGSSRAIYNSGTGNLTISNNLIANIASNSTLATLGLRMIEITGGVATITSNIIHDITFSGPSTWTDYDAAVHGIEVRSGLAGQLIEGNTIYNLSATDITSTSTVTAQGIRVTTGVGSVLRNSIYNIYNSNPNTAANIFGINIAGGVWTIANNLIAIGTGVGNQTNISGIFDNSTGVNAVYFNSVNISGTATTGANSTYAVNKASTSILTAKNNIFSNQRTGGTGFHYAAKLPNTTSIVTDYNDWYVTGAQLATIAGTNYANFAAYKAVTLQDANSKNADPQFYSATDLHVWASALDNTGIAISGITTDKAGTTRTNPPDIGAYEFSLIPVVSTLAANGITGSSATVNGTINAMTQTVTSGFDYGLTIAYGTSVAGTPATVTGISDTPISASTGSLLPNTLYHFRATGTANASTVNGSDLTFTTSAVAPTAVTDAATLITGVGAQLNGTVNANNSSTVVTFEYGLTTGYGTVVTAAQSPVSGYSNTPVTFAVSGLNPNTLYHYRVIAVNGAGTTNGTDVTFTTSQIAPTAVTVAASPIGSTTATLNGNVIANNLSTTVTFEYGLTVAYGTIVAATPGTVTGMTNTAVSASLSSLLIGSTYHFRVIAVNGAGTTYGSDLTFLTGCPQPADAGTITGPTNVCQTGTGYIYSVPTIANASSYVWTLPSGFTITNGSNTNTITVSVSASASSGNVTVYGASTCSTGSPSSLAVTANSLPVPTISGTTPICATNSATYTTQAGMTNYVWSVSGGGSITAGGTATSSTVTVLWNTAGAQSVSVNYNNSNGCSANAPTVYPVTVNALPVPTVSGPSNVCVGNSGNVYTTQAGMNSYAWVVSAGGTITAGGTATSNTVTVTWNTVGAQLVSVNYNSVAGCTGSTAGTQAVTVNPRPSPTLSGPNSICVLTTGNVYTTEAGMSAYAWTVSSGGTITSGGTSNSNTVTVTWNSAGAQSVAVNYNNGSGCPANTATSYPVTVNSLPVPTISGTSTVCSNHDGTYSTQAGMTDYQWSVTGGTITAGAGTNAITVNFTSPGTQNVYVNYDNSNGCSAVNPVSYPVTVYASPAPTITGPATACESSINNLYTTQAGMTNYVWEITPGAGQISQNGTNQISVYWTVPGDNWINVSYTNGNGCNTDSPSVYDVYVSPLPVAITAIDGQTTLCAGTEGVTYTATADANTASYVWTVPIGVTIISGATTNSITVNYALTATSGDFTVYGINNCGDGPITSLAVTINPIPATPVITENNYLLTSSAADGNQWYKDGVLIDGAVSQTYDVFENGVYTVIVTLNDCSSAVSNSIEIVNVGFEEVNAPKISVYPNPNTGAFWITIASSNSVTYELEVLDSYGSSVYQTGDLQVNGTFKRFIDLRTLSAGVYSLVLKSDTQQIIRKIVINK